jgi:hypothetical protein
MRVLNAGAGLVGWLGDSITKTIERDHYIANAHHT